MHEWFNLGTRFTDSRSVQLVARIIQTPVRDSQILVACISMHDRTTHGTLFTLSEYSRFRATSCTLRFTTEPRTERNKAWWFLREFFQTTHYQPSRALFISNVACNLLHEWFNLDTRFTDSLVACILMHERFNPDTRFTDSLVACNLLHEWFTKGTK